MTTRDRSYKDYNLSVQDIRLLLEYCRCPDADLELIMECAIASNKDIAEHIYKSLVMKKSYDRMQCWEFIPISKNDFYGYRRKLLAILKEKLIEKYG